MTNGEVAWGNSFIFGFDGRPTCEGTSDEIGGIALIKGGHNTAKMSPLENPSNTPN